MYSDNFQNMYVYSCIKILRGITTPMSTTVDNNRKHLQCKFSQTKMAKYLVSKEEILNNDQWLKC